MPQAFYASVQATGQWHHTSTSGGAGGPLASVSLGTLGWPTARMEVGFDASYWWGGGWCGVFIDAWYGDDCLWRGYATEDTEYLLQVTCGLVGEDLVFKYYLNGVLKATHVNLGATNYPEKAQGLVNYGGDINLYCYGEMGPLEVVGTGGSVFSPWDDIANLDDWDYHTSDVVVDTNAHLIRCPDATYERLVHMRRKAISVTARAHELSTPLSTPVTFSLSPDSDGITSPRTTPFSLYYLWKLLSDNILETSLPDPAGHEWAGWVAPFPSSRQLTVTPADVYAAGFYGLNVIAFYSTIAAPHRGVTLLKGGPGRPIWTGHTPTLNNILQEQFEAGASIDIHDAAPDYAQSPSMWQTNDGARHAVFENQGHLLLGTHDIYYNKFGDSNLWGDASLLVSGAQAPTALRLRPSNDVLLTYWQTYGQRYRKLTWNGDSYTCGAGYNLPLGQGYAIGQELGGSPATALALLSHGKIQCFYHSSVGILSMTADLALTPWSTPTVLLAPGPTSPSMLRLRPSNDLLLVCVEYIPALLRSVWWSRKLTWNGATHDVGEMVLINDPNYPPDRVRAGLVMLNDGTIQCHYRDTSGGIQTRCTDLECASWV